MKRGWGRDGRGGVGVACMLRGDIEERGMGTNPWKILEDSIHTVESIDSLLLNIEELYRAKRQPPSEELILKWINGRKIDQHLSLIVIYSGKIHQHDFSEELMEKIASIEIPSGDSILTRIKSNLNEN